MNKNYCFFFTIMLFVILFSTSCIISIDGHIGKGTIVNQQCYVASFTAIESASSANVEITKGETFEVVLSDYENLLELWDIKVVNKTLIIQNKPFSTIANSHAKVSIVMPDQLQSVKVSGSANIDINSPFSSFSKGIIAGSGNINGNSNSSYSNLILEISGSGRINLNGSAEQLKAVTSGSGKMYLSDLYVKSAECIVAGSGSQYVSVENNLVATISGSGNIIYSGNPIIDISDSGSGRLIKK